MNRKIPSDAFETYFALGPDRSYQTVAEKYGVTKKAVTAAAKRERWQERLQERERRSQEQVEQQAVESMTAMKQRHLKLMEAIEGKAVQTLRNMPIETAYQAVRALIASVEQQRVIRGEPTERTAIDIEKIIRREYETCFLKPGEKDDWNFDGPRP